MKIGRHYLSIISIIIVIIIIIIISSSSSSSSSNIIVLVSYNVVYFEYFVPMSHGVKKKAPWIVSPQPSPLPGFNQVCLLFYKILYQPYLLWSNYCEDDAFSNKTIFSFNLFLVGFDFAILCICVSRALFHSSAIMTLRINNVSFA